MTRLSTHEAGKLAAEQAIFVSAVDALTE